MATETKGVTGTQFSIESRTQVPFEKDTIIETGLCEIIEYGYNQFCLIDDQTSITPSTAQFRLDHLTERERVVLVPAGSEGPASDFGLPAELGIIKIK